MDAAVAAEADDDMGSPLAPALPSPPLFPTQPPPRAPSPLPSAADLAPHVPSTSQQTPATPSMADIIKASFRMRGLSYKSRAKRRMVKVHEMGYGVHRGFKNMLHPPIL